MTRYRLARLISCLPFPVIRFLMRRFPGVYRDPSDGWNLWLDADYERYCRRDET